MPAEGPNFALCQAFPPPASAAVLPRDQAPAAPATDQGAVGVGSLPTMNPVMNLRRDHGLLMVRIRQKKTLLGSPERGEIPKIWVPIIPIIPWFSWYILII